MQLTGEPAAQGLDFRAKGIDRAEQPLCCFVDPVAVLGNPEAGPAALAQPHVQPRLECGHVRAYRGLADVHGDLCGREAAAFHDSRKDTQQAYVHLTDVEVRRHELPLKTNAFANTLRKFNVNILASLFFEGKQ